MVCARVSTSTLFASALLVLGSFGCSADDAPPSAMDTSSTSGDGDGDPSSTSGDGDGDPSTTSGDGDGEPATGDGDGDPTTSGDGDGDPTTSGDGDGEPGIECDWQVEDDGILMFEAESLPINEQWLIASDVPEFYADGYIYWSGQSFNNQPGNGQMDVTLGIPEAGRYRVQWRTQIGMGDNATEHNDIWLRFPDAADYYGKAGDNPETRRYPAPICNDAAFIEMIEALPEVSDAGCANGSTSDGWMKVYSSGATMWKWSTRTSDNDAHDIYVEFDAPGAYTMQFSARADFMLLDRVVIHREDVDNALAQAEDQAETPCD